MILGDRHPVSGSLLILTHLFHYGDGDLCFFPVSWEFLFGLVEVEFLALSILGCRCVRPTFLYDFCTVSMGPLSPVLAFSLVVFCCSPCCFLPG